MTEKTKQNKSKKAVKAASNPAMEVEVINMKTGTSSIIKDEVNRKQGKKRKQQIVEQTNPVKQPKVKEKKKESKSVKQEGSINVTKMKTSSPAAMGDRSTKEIKVKEVMNETKKKKKNSGKNIKGKFKTVFVGGLDTKVPRETITEFFTNHGVTVYEVRKKGGRRFCHVDLLNPDDLEKALTLNGKKIGGNRVKINSEKEHFDTKVLEVKSQTLFVKNIEATVSKDALRDLFPKAVSIKYPKTESGKNKGFAYIKMETIEQVKEYLMKKNIELKGHKLVLDSVEKGTRHSKILRVRNLNFETTKDMLEEVFDKSKSIKLCVNSAGKSIGTAIVTFDTIEEAKKAQKEKQKFEVDGRNITVTFIETEEQPNIKKKKKKFGKEERWGRKKSSAYEKKRRPQNIVKKSDGKLKSFKK